jgi:hypothetical protein
LSPTVFIDANHCTDRPPCSSTGADSAGEVPISISKPFLATLAVIGFKESSIQNNYFGHIHQLNVELQVLFMKALFKRFEPSASMKPAQESSYKFPPGAKQLTKNRRRCKKSRA